MRRSLLRRGGWRAALGAGGPARAVGGLPAPAGARASRVRSSELFGCILAVVTAGVGLAPGCTCSKPGRGSEQRSSVVVVDPEEVGRPQPVGETEPNDSPQRAQELTLERGIEGSLADKDKDWYRVTVDSDGQVLAALLSGVAGMDLVLEAYGQKRARLVRVNNSGEGEGETLVNLAPGRGVYYLVVSEAKGRSAPGRYRLRYQLRPQEEGEEREPNWKASLATPLALEGEAAGYLGWQTDTDWYRVDLAGLPAGARLRVEYDGLDEVRANLSLRQPGGAVLQERSGGKGEGVVLPNIVAGQSELFVVVRCGAQFNVESRYSLRVTSSVPSGAVEAEPNDRPANATPVPSGVAVAGLLTDTQDRDVYEVRVAAPGTLRVEAAPPLGLDLALAALGDDGSVRLEVDSGRAREPELLPSLGVRPPRVLLQVRAPRSDQVNAVTPYHLKTTLLGDGWEREPNDTAEAATPWPADRAVVEGYIFPKDDKDSFRVATTGDKLVLAADPVPKVALHFELLDAGGAVLARSVSDAQGKLRLEAQVTPGSESVLRVSDPHGGCAPRDAYRITRVNP